MEQHEKIPPQPTEAWFGQRGQADYGAARSFYGFGVPKQGKMRHVIRFFAWAFLLIVLIPIAIQIWLYVSGRNAL